MPAQATSAGTVYYSERDTAPPLRACLKDGQGNPIDLSQATVTFTMAFSMPRGSYYTSPRRQIITRSPCVVDNDQSEEGNRGFVSWTPENREQDILTPAGEFLYNFEVIYSDGGRQTIPANTYQTLIITSPVGGTDAAVGLGPEELGP